MNEVKKKPRALRDLARHAAYLEEHANLSTAERFLDVAEDAFARLAAMPNMGRRREMRSTRFAALRQWPIRNFENYLIFYQPIENGIEVLRVLHGARDIDRILEEEAGEEETP